MSHSTDGGEIFIPHSKKEDVIGGILVAIVIGLVLYAPWLIKLTN